MPNTTTCPRCGKPVNAAVKRCPFCNQPLEGAPPAPAFDFVAAADQAIAAGRPLLALEYHPAAVTALDAFIDLTWGEQGLATHDDKWTPGAEGNAIMSLGAFFGELMRRQFGWQWRPLPEAPGNLAMTTVAVPNGLNILPIAKVFKRLKNGVGDRLEPLYREMRRKCGAPSSAGELDGWVRQIDHFEGVHRHDIAVRLYDGALQLPLAPPQRAELERRRAAAAAAWGQHETEKRVARAAEAEEQIGKWAEFARNALTEQRVRTEGGTATLIAATDRFVDDVIARNRDRLPKSQLGAFLGELLRTRYGGVWRKLDPEAPPETWQVAWPSGTSIDPFAMIEQRLLPAPEGGKSLLQQMAELEKALEEKGDAKAPPENPNDWMAQADEYAKKPARLDVALFFASVALQSGGDGPAARLKLARWCQELGRLPQARAHLDAAIKFDDKSPVFWLERARVGWAQQAIEPAQADASRCLELDPTEANAHLVRGACLIARGENEAALADMERAVELAPQSVEGLLGKASALLATGRAREALEWTKVFGGRGDCEPARTRLAAIAADQAGEPVLAHEMFARLQDDARLSAEQREQARARAAALAETKEVALAAAQQLDPAPAVEAYERLSLRFPAWPEPWRERGVGLAMLGRTEPARQCLDRAIELAPTDPIAHDHKAVILGRLKRYDQALALLDRALRLCPKSGTLWSRRGVFLSMSGRNDEAATAFAKSVEVDPDYLLAWAYKGDVEAQLGRTAEAIASLTRFLEARRGSREKAVEAARRQLWSIQHPDQPLDPQEAANLHSAALAVAGTRDFTAALALFDQALARNPLASDVWCNRGTALGQLGRYEEALQSFGEAEKIDGPLSNPMRGAAQALERLGRGEEALACFDRCLANAAAPDPQIWREKARLLIRLGRAAEALPIYVRLVARAPRDAALLRERAQALEAAGRALEARAASRAAQAAEKQTA